MEGSDIKNVIDSKCIKEYKTGYWKAQFNLLENGKYMVEIYWFSYYLEKANNKNWHSLYDNEFDAEEKYRNINLKDLRRGDLK
jgi:hypothetical protein